MNGKNAYDSFAAVGPLTYSNTDRIGVDLVNIYKVEGGQFKAISSIESEFMKKVRAKM